MYVRTADGKRWSIPRANLKEALSRPGVRLEASMGPREKATFTSPLDFTDPLTLGQNLATAYQGITEKISEIENYTQEGRKEHPRLASLGDVLNNLQELMKSVGPEVGLIGLPELKGASVAKAGIETAEESKLPKAAADLLAQKMRGLMGLPKLKGFSAAKSASEALEESKLPKAAADLLAPKGFSEKLSHARDFIGEKMRGSLEAMQSRAKSYAGNLFDKATEQMDSASPNGVSSVDALNSKIHSIIAEETTGIPELEERVKAALPKSVRKLMTGEPSELEQASVFRGRRVGFTGRAVSQASEMANRLQESGLSAKEIKSALLNMGYSARDVDMASIGLKESNAVSASRLNEIQREIGEEAFSNNSPESRILKKIYYSISSDLDAAAAKAGKNTQTLWSHANAEWKKYLEVFREGPIGRAIESDTASKTVNAIGGENLRTAVNHLAHYARQGDTDYSKAIGGLRQLQRIDKLEKARAFVQKRWPYALLWPAMELMRGNPKGAAEEGAGVTATEMMVKKFLERMIMSGSTVPPVAP